METIPEKAMNSIQPGLAHYAAPHYMQFWVQEADFLGRTPKDQMNNVEQFQQKAKEQSDAAMASVNTLAASVQAITTAHADYTKKALQDGSEFMTKLTSLKAPGDFMSLQSEYAKTTYETFVAEAKKISELYADLAKQAYKPLEGLVAKMTPAKQ
jgi:phasin family protein